MDNSNMVIYVTIALVTIPLLIGLVIFFHAFKQQRQLHETILRAQNEKEIETYSHIAGEYLHQQVINGRILPHLIRLKELNQLVETIENPKNQMITNKIQELVTELNQTENIIRHISENIFPPHLTYFFTETCQKRLDKLAQLYSNNAQLTFRVDGQFNDLSHHRTLLYNLYSLIDLFVSNSLQHAAASQISIILKRQADKITLEMSDNGKGFNLKEITKNTTGRGLADLRGRAIILSPHYFFNSELGEGTQFKISTTIEQQNL